LSFFSLAIATVFVYFPGQLVTGNASEIAEPLRFCFVFAGLGSVAMALAWAVSRFLDRGVRTVAIVLAAYGVSIYFADLAFPLEIGPIETGGEEVPARPLGALVQALVFLVAAGACWFLPPRRTSNIAWFAAAVLVASSGVTVVASLPREETPVVKAFAAEPEQPNIYHVVFDAYHGPWLKHAMKEWGMPEGTFDGFTYYPKALANSIPTRVSFPSFLSGSLYTPDLTVSQWLRHADTDNIISDLNKAGYNTTVYAIRSRHGFRPAQRFVAPEADPATMTLLADYWALRVLPVALRTRALESGKGLITKISSSVSDKPTGDLRTYNSYRQFQQFLRDEAARPKKGQYVLVHLYSPHGPYHMDRHGRYTGNSTYIEQLYLATSQMKQIVERLKQMGKFDDSLIIFHSDHGTREAVGQAARDNPELSFLRMDAATSKAIEDADVAEEPGWAVEAVHSALLMVKNPSHCGGHTMTRQFTLDDRQVELKGLRRHVSAVRAGECSFPVADSVDVLHGLSWQKQTKDGKKLLVGRDLKSGVVSHYRISGGTWKIVEPIPFQY
jgi:hypothetical protein